MPILTLSSLKLVLGSNLIRPAHMYMNTNFLQRHGYMAPWPLAHKMLNSASIPQTFSATPVRTELHFQLHDTAKRHEYWGREL